MHSPSPLILSCPPCILASLSQNPSHAHAAVAKCRTDALLLVWKKIVLPTPHSQGQTPGPRRRAKFHHAICSASAHALPPWARAGQYFSHVAATGRRHVLPMKEEEDGAVHGMAARGRTAGVPPRRHRPARAHAMNARCHVAAPPDRRAATWPLARRQTRRHDSYGGRADALLLGGNDELASHGAALPPRERRRAAPLSHVVPRLCVGTNLG